MLREGEGRQRAGTETASSTAPGLGFPSRLHSLFIQLREDEFTCPAANQSLSLRSRRRARGGAPSPPWCPVGAARGYRTRTRGSRRQEARRRTKPCLGPTSSRQGICLSLLVLRDRVAWPWKSTHSNGDLPVGKGTTCPHPPGKYVKCVLSSGEARLGPMQPSFKQGTTCRNTSLLCMCVCVHT